MYVRFDESCTDLDSILVELPQQPVSPDPQEEDPIKAGYGSCRSCGCTGYKPGKPSYCECGHHFSQHR